MKILEKPSRLITNLVATKLPAGAKLHPEFGVMEYRKIGVLKKKFKPTKFLGLEGRQLAIVPAESVEAGYSYDSEQSLKNKVRSEYNVVISWAK